MTGYLDELAARPHFARGLLPVDERHPYVPFYAMLGVTGPLPIPEGWREEDDAEFGARILRGDAKTPGPG